jgi:hypothetical protein
MKYYFLFIHDGKFPKFFGPYDLESERDDAAKSFWFIHRKEGHLIFKVQSLTDPQIFTFTDSELTFNWT